MPAKKKSPSLDPKHYRVGGKTVFYKGKKVYGADAATFKSRADGFGEDEHDIFFKTYRLVGADSTTIQYLGGDYIKDKHKVWWRRYELGAHAESFIVLNPFLQWAQDKDKLFNRSKRRTSWPAKEVKLKYKFISDIWLFNRYTDDLPMWQPENSENSD